MLVISYHGVIMFLDQRDGILLLDSAAAIFQPSLEGTGGDNSPPPRKRRRIDTIEQIVSSERVVVSAYELELVRRFFPSRQPV